jgi:hypothetical protein
VAVTTTNIRRGMGRIGVAALAASALAVGLVAAAAPAGATQSKSYLGVYQALNQLVTSLSEDAVVPNYTCKKADQVDIYANVFDQDGGSPGAFDGAFLGLACAKGNVPELVPYLEVDGTYAAAGVSISVGDTIEITVTCGSTGSVETIADLTHGGSSSTGTSAPSSCNGAFFGNIGVSKGSSGTKELPLPTFGSISFSNVEVNGAPLGDASPSPTSVNYFEGKKNQIVVGPLTAGGSAFVNTQTS